MGTVGTVRAGLLALASCIIAVGCSDRTDDDACADADAQAQWSEAAEVCQRAWRTGGDPQTGYRWARAAARQGDIWVAQRLLDQLDDRSVVSARTRYLVAADLRVHGELERAEESFLQALSVFEERGDFVRAAAVARVIAAARLRAGRYADAESMAVASLTLAERTENEQLVYEALLELAALHGEVGRDALAVAVRDRALALRPDDPLSLGVRGDRARDAGRLSMADVLYRQASAALADRGDWKAQRIIALNLIDVGLRRGDVAAARAFLDVETRAREASSGGAAFEDLLPNVRSSATYYAARVALAEGDPEAAAASLALGRAHALGPDWAWQFALLEGQIHAARGDARRALTSALEALDAPAAESSTDAFHAQDRIRRRRDAVDVAVRAAEALDDVAAMLELVDRLHLQRREARTPLDLHEIEAVLAGRSAVVYIVSDDAVSVLARVFGRWQRWTTKLPQAELERLVAAFVADFDDDAGSRLSALLLPSELLASGVAGELVLVPDGALETIPWAALPLSDGPLILRFDPIVAPSLRPAPFSQAGGAPVFVTDPQGDLPRARAEGRRWAPRLHGTQWSAAAAARDRLAGLRTDLLHLAVHSGQTEGHAWISLADGRVSARELATLGVDARTVVLATCASTTARNGDIWTSVPGAFLLRGSNLVVGTLWSVNDTSAERFVQALYEDHGARIDAGTVSAAQRKLLQSSDDPRQWAGYVAMGHLLERDEDTP